MALLYDVSYYTMNRKRHAGCDSSMPIGNAWAPRKNTIAFCQCVNGDPAHRFYVNERGDTFGTFEEALNSLGK